MIQLEFIIFILSGLLLLLLVWRCAEYGVVETCRYDKKFRLISFVFVSLLLLLAVLDLFAGDIRLSGRPETARVGRWLIIGALVLFFARTILLEPGIRELNRARVRFLYLMPEYFHSGKILHKGFELEDFDMAKQAIRLLNKAITKNGGRDILIQPIVNPFALLRMAMAYSEKGAFLRIMNCFCEAEKKFGKSLALISRLVEEGADTPRCWELKSLTLLRLGELEHCLGSKVLAQDYYQESLKISQAHNDNSGEIFAIRALMLKLSVG